MGINAGRVEVPNELFDFTDREQAALRKLLQDMVIRRLQNRTYRNLVGEVFNKTSVQTGIDELASSVRTYQDSAEKEFMFWVKATVESLDNRP